MKISGVIQDGEGKGAFFTQLDWVVEQCERGLGFKPFPGTLNVRIDDADLSKLDAFFVEKDCKLVPDNPDFCCASLKKVKINGLFAAVVFPSEDVRIHGKEVIEIISDCHIKDALQLSNGDEVIITDISE